MISILWNGDVVACCMNYDGKYILGNVKEESLKDIWNNEKMRLLRKSVTNKDLSKPEPCLNCERPYKSTLTFKKLLKEIKLY